MPYRIAGFSAAAVFVCVLWGCASSAVVPKAAPVAAVAHPSAGKDCSAPAPSGGVLSSIDAKFEGMLVVGERSTAQIHLQGSFKKRGKVRGVLKKPLTVTLDDPLGHVRLSCTKVWDLYRAPSISSDGHGDVFTVRLAFGTTTFERSYWTNLPKDIPLSTHSPYIDAAWIRFGSDGNLWAPLRNTIRPIAVARISLSGKTTIFTDPSAPSSPAIDKIVLGPDGNMWIPYVNSYGSGSAGMDRIAPDGTFTAFPFGGSAYYQVSAMIAGHHDDIVLGLSNGSGGAIASFKTDGTTKLLTKTSQPPRNLVWDKDGNLWFSLDSLATRESARAELGKLTPTGSLKTYAICCFNKFAGAYDGAFFITAAPNGKGVWAPYPYGKSVLLEIDTNGRVVSSGKIPYFTPWEIAAPLTAPDITDFATDAAGNVYASDEGDPGSEYGASGLIRITPQGEVTEYPTFRIVGGEPTSVVYDPAKKLLYLANTYYIPSKSSEGSIVAVDPRSW